METSNTRTVLWLLALLVLLLLLSLAVRSMVYGDEMSGEYAVSAQVAASKEHQLYLEECGSCHIAYPASLLPQQSWQALMVGLEDHFGENAELIAADQALISQYLMDNAAKPGDEFLEDIANSAPLRITELPYFVHEHEDIDQAEVVDNPEVLSFSNCSACHQKGEQGIFDDDTARIPVLAKSNENIKKP